MEDVNKIEIVKIEREKHFKIRKIVIVVEGNGKMRRDG